MAYNYNYDVATSRTKVILRLLFRWRGSVWQAVYIELIIWWILYALISIVYRFGLNGDQQVSFEKFAKFCDNRMKYIPLDFMLSFFVTTVVNRWHTQFANLGMIDNIPLFTSAYIQGNDERGRQLRRNIVRYCVLSQALVFRDIHLGVRKRFPTLDTMVSAGFMMKHEQEKFEGCKSRYAKYWMPLNWALHLCNAARREGRINHPQDQNSLIMQIREFRTGLSLIWTYDWVPLPIMYPQLIYLAVHVYFLVALFSRQFIVKPEIGLSEIDLYFPFMTTLQFIFYMGWLKVAMALLNPFGDDDEDFDCNFLLDRNLTVALTCVDEAFDDVPDVLPDAFYNDTVSPLYSSEAAKKNVNFYVGSATRVVLPEGTKEVEMVPHPVNERLDRFIKKPARTRRTTVVSIKSESQSPMDELVRDERAISFSNILRKRRNTNTSADFDPESRKAGSVPKNIFLSPNTYNNTAFVEEIDPESKEEARHESVSETNINDIEPTFHIYRNEDGWSYSEHL